jgi:plasmid replication initiation protein
MAKLQVHNYAKLPNEYVAVDRSRGLSTLEEKLVYMLINSMQKHYESNKKTDIIDYEFISKGIINFDTFIEIMQIGAKDNSIIYQSLKDLFNFSLAIETTDEIRFVHLFKEFRVVKSERTIKYWFADNFIQYFTGICKDYFSLEVQEVISLNSSNTIRIYQILKSKLNMDKNDHVYTINEIKKYLNIEEKYNRYNNLKQFVLEVAKSQINSSEASKFAIDYEEIKTGKAVTSIKFIIHNKGKNYYVEKNLIAGYKIEQLNKQIKGWLVHEDVLVRHAAGKIASELKYKKPSRAAITAYLDAIKTVIGQPDHHRT